MSEDGRRRIFVMKVRLRPLFLRFQSIRLVVVAATAAVIIAIIVAVEAFVVAAHKSVAISLRESDVIAVARIVIPSRLSDGAVIRSHRVAAATVVRVAATFVDSFAITLLHRRAIAIAAVIFITVAAVVTTVIATVIAAVIAAIFLTNVAVVPILRACGRRRQNSQTEDH